MVPPIALGMTLWVAGKVLLLGLLILMHWGQRRFRAVPPPLFQKRTPVTGATRAFEGVLGIGACYALCVFVYFVSLLGQPQATSLTLNPVEGGPAARAGLLPGDRARSVEGTEVHSFDEFRDAVARGPASVSIEVDRKGRVVPLRIRKNQENRIGVAPVLGEPMTAAAALARAVPAPAIFIVEWASHAVRALTGEVKVAGPAAFGVAAAGDHFAWVQVLALVLIKDLAGVACVYIVILAADARSRSRYHAAQAL